MLNNISSKLSFDYQGILIEINQWIPSPDDIILYNQYEGDHIFIGDEYDEHYFKMGAGKFSEIKIVFTDNKHYLEIRNNSAILQPINHFDDYIEYI